MSHRQILRTRSGSQQQVRAILESIFVAEVLSPSPRLYLVSAWVRDFRVLDNRGGGFQGLDPSWGRRSLRLAEILRILVERGSELVLAVRPERGNRDFVDRFLRDLSDGGKERVALHIRESLHVKGLLGQSFAVTGSMNFTNNGVENNEELLSYETDPRKLAELRVEFEQAYGGPA